MDDEAEQGMRVRVNAAPDLEPEVLKPTFLQGGGDSVAKGQKQGREGHQDCPKGSQW